MKDEAFASGIGRSESVKKLETHHRGTEAQRRRGEKPPLPKALSAKTLRLCGGCFSIYSQPLRSFVRIAA